MLRILPSSHTNPIFILGAIKPLAQISESAHWCLNAVDMCWKQKQGRIAETEKEAAKSDYESSKIVYRKVKAECEE